jgi:hypothetical protein
VINKPDYKRIMKAAETGQKQPKSRRRKRPLVSGYKRGDLVWIERQGSSSKLPPAYFAGEVMDVCETRLWVRYKHGDTVYMNKYYPERLLKREAGETAPSQEAIQNAAQFKQQIEAEKGRG